MNAGIKKPLVATIIISVMLQLSACGTILYPERKGQNAGQLDTAIVALDAIGLLFFLVPGVIAFAVDFNNGSIYLPSGSASVDSGNFNIVNIDGELTDDNIENVILRETGKSIDLSESEVLVHDEALSLGYLSST